MHCVFPLRLVKFPLVNMCNCFKKKQADPNNEGKFVCKLSSISYICPFSPRLAKQSLKTTRPNPKASNTIRHDTTLFPSSPSKATSSPSSPRLPELMNQSSLKDQYFKEVEAMRREYEIGYQEYRKLYEQDCSMSKLKDDFTEIVHLTGWTTVAEVLKSKNYYLQKRVGKGGYGTVYKTVFSNERVTKIVACKVISIESGSRRKLLKNLKSEVFVLERYPHPNIITLLDHFVIANKAYIIMEFADAGSLGDLLYKNGSLTEPLAYEYFVQMLKGVFYLHTFRIAHR